MTEIQEELPDKITEDVNVAEDYCTRRSFRKGTEVGVLNIRVAPDPVISAIN